jgi:hypothetical protein
MKHSEIIEDKVIDASDIFKQRRDNLELKKAQDQVKLKTLPSIELQIQKVIDEKIREAKDYLNNEMKKFRFVTNKFNNNETVFTALFMPLVNDKDPNHDKIVQIVLTYKSELIEIIEGYTERLKHVMAEARTKAEELTGNWRDANDLLTNSKINKLFEIAGDLWHKIYYLTDRK